MTDRKPPQIAEQGDQANDTPTMRKIRSDPYWKREDDVESERSAETFEGVWAGMKDASASRKPPFSMPRADAKSDFYVAQANKNWDISDNIDASKRDDGRAAGVASNSKYSGFGLDYASVQSAADAESERNADVFDTGMAKAIAAGIAGAEGAEREALPFLTKRRSILERDNAKMLTRKRANQAGIARLRAENVQLTQSIRSNEDGLDRLLENEG